MKSLVVACLSVAVLTVGLFVPEGHAKQPDKVQRQALLAFQKQQVLSLKELNKQYVSSVKELKGSWKTQGFTVKEYASKNRELQKQFLAQVKAWNKSSRQELVAFVKNGYKCPDNSVPIPGTVLLLAGGFAGVIGWRARQQAA